VCGRFTLFSGSDEVSAYFKLSQKVVIEADYNIAPGQNILAILRCSDDSLVGQKFHWGLIPSWAKDKKIAYRMINTRAETIDKKTAFMRAFKKRRCIIVMDGFFEWLKKDQDKQPYYVEKKDHGLLGIAGIWENWQGTGEKVIKSCSIITTSANAKMVAIHDRMPVILQQSDFATWLNIDVFCLDELKQLLKPYPLNELVYYPVSRKVNNARYKSGDAIAPR
jgi:putative SOS response-associated peptidase YedK